MDYLLAVQEGWENDVIDEMRYLEELHGIEED